MSRGEKPGPMSQQFTQQSVSCSPLTNDCHSQPCCPSLFDHAVITFGEVHSRVLHYLETVGSGQLLPLPPVSTPAPPTASMQISGYLEGGAKATPWLCGQPSVPPNRCFPSPINFCDCSKEVDLIQGASENIFPHTKDVF